MLGPDELGRKVAWLWGEAARYVPPRPPAMTPSWNFWYHVVHPF